jgi:HTH-type transcriptional regulator/antitoxin HigA
MIQKNTKEYIKSKKEEGLYGIDFLDAVHPGVTLQEELDFFGITQKELATKIGYTVQTVNRIIKGKESITTDMALALQRVFDGHPSAEFWLAMQADYDKEVSQANELESTEEEIQFFKDNIKTTFKELQKGGVFDDYTLSSEDSYKKSVVKTKDFFGSHSLLTMSEEILLGVPFRKYNRSNINQYNLSAILKIGEKKARKILKGGNVDKYEEKVFTEKLASIKGLSTKAPKEFLGILQEECLALGVVVVYVPNMTHTAFGGATLWISDHPVILLKIENQREDIFWFNFFHEVGHIIKHRKKDIFIDFDKDGNKEKEEIEADEFAENILIPNFDEISRKVEKGLPVDKWIEYVSRVAGVSKSIAAGRLCNVVSFDGVWKILNQYRPTIKEKASFL